VLDVAAGNRPNIIVFGNDYETPDGTCIRDYVHVSDLADAHVLAMKRLDTGGVQHAYNLGTGRGFSVTQVIEAARSTTGRNIPVVKGPRRRGDPAVLLADPSQARGDLGWHPKYPEIAAIVASAWRWSSSNSPVK
jgi:UDP-glucose 4-epimerase